MAEVAELSKALSFRSDNAEERGREFLSSKKPPRVLLLWREAPSRFDFLERVLVSMAELAVDVFPEAPAQGAQISPTWFRLAREKIFGGKLPILDVSYQQNIGELSMLIGKNLEIMLVLNCKKFSEEDELFFMKKAQWLAECADACVSVVFNETDIFSSLSAQTFSNIAARDFFSIPERLLWDGMQKESELIGQFVVNNPFKTVLGREILPDFFCEKLGLCVEVDGYTYHAGKKHFASDRQRDYEMTLSGCTTLRIPAQEIMKNVSLAVKKVLNVFRFKKEEMKAHAKVG